MESLITLVLLGNGLARQGEFDEAKTCLNDALDRRQND